MNMSGLIPWNTVEQPLPMIVQVVAKQPIPAGAEIVINYGDNINDINDAVSSQAGSSNILRYSTISPCYVARRVDLVAGGKIAGRRPKSMSLRSTIVQTTATEPLHHAEVPA